jgi:UDP-N-acetyl-D-mannosaminuronic acid dehydrogenase
VIKIEFKVSVFGIGKAGLPLAAVIADAGFNVIGVGKDHEKIEKINLGINPIPEEFGLTELVKKHSGKKLIATADFKNAVKESQVHIIIVPLYIDENKKPNFDMIEDAAKKIGSNLKVGDIVVLETTVPVGTTKNLIKNILEKNSSLKCGKDFYLAYSPERIMTGFSISRFKEFPKVVGGVDEESTKKAIEFYKKFCKNVIGVRNSDIAEMTKIVEGIYRDVNIALANELLKICDKHNVNFWDVREAAKHKYCDILEPGNVGGHCIPIYPWFVIDSYTKLIKTARLVNDEMIEYFTGKVKEITKKGKGNKVGVIGLTFREGVKEINFSRSRDFINLLKRQGFDVYGLDPLLTKEEIEKLGVKSLENFDDMDCIVLMNKNFEYTGKLNKIKHKVIDIKNVLG